MGMEREQDWRGLCDEVFSNTGIQMGFEVTKECEAEPPGPGVGEKPEHSHLPAHLGGMIPRGSLALDMASGFSH